MKGFIKEKVQKCISINTSNIGKIKTNLRLVKKQIVHFTRDEFAEWFEKHI